MARWYFLAGLGLMYASGSVADTIAPASLPSGAIALPMKVNGRTVTQPGIGLARQWPGTYFETSFKGTDGYLKIGSGEVSLRISVDGAVLVVVVRPTPGFYRLEGLSSGQHRIRVDVMSESQAEPTIFGGFFAAKGSTSLPTSDRVRRIEFIGDSHTVGYGNTSLTQQCTEREVWDRTDTSRGLPAILAARYDADYEVNAISGRGVVRNYNGFEAATVPQAYPLALFGRADLPAPTSKKPDVIVISLGTNDFSTPLRPQERWKTRDQLRADYEATYVKFVQGLRQHAPRAFIVLWSSEDGDGEIKREVGRVADQLVKAGDQKVGFVSVPFLSFSACNHHPNTADDRLIANTIAEYLNGRRDAWSEEQVMPLQIKGRLK